MSARFVNIDRDTPLLLPEDLRKWVPENHMVHFIIEALGKPDIRNFKVNEKGSGDEQYPPEMMPALLIYGYVTKRLSSRVLEEATCLNIGARYICGNKAHPGHRVLKRVGVVELTAALHYVFDTPHDKLIWDVGHQAYAHKILNGRRDVFHTNRKYNGISGFPRRSESEYDPYGGGHSSVSISAALGMATAAELQ